MLSLVLAALVAILVLGLMFKPLFGSAAGFWECVRFWIRPDLWSAIRGEFYEDWWAEMKLFLWAALGGASFWAVRAAFG